MFRTRNKDRVDSQTHGLTTSTNSRGNSPIYVCVSDITVPCITDYLVQVTLQHDEDQDEQIPAATSRLSYRSDEWHDAVAVNNNNVSATKLELACVFVFPRSAIKLLRLHDARLLIEILGINPGSGAIVTAAKDVFNLVIDESNDSVVSISETRFLSGSFWDRPAQLHVGRYTIEVSGTEFGNADFVGIAEEGYDELPKHPTMISEEKSMLLDSVGGTLNEPAFDRLDEENTSSRIEVEHASQSWIVETVVFSVANIPRSVDEARTSRVHGLLNSQTSSGESPLRQKDAERLSQSARPGSDHREISVRMVSRATGAILCATARQPISPAHGASFPRAYRHAPVDTAVMRPTANVGFEVVEHAVPTSRPASALGDSTAEGNASVLAWFPLSLARLRPLHQYNLELIRSSDGDTDSARLAPRLYACVRVSPYQMEEVASPHDVLQVAIAEAADMAGGVTHAAGSDGETETEPLMVTHAAGLLVADHEAHRKAYHHSSPHQTMHDHSDPQWTITVPSTRASDFVVPAFGGLRGSGRSPVQLVHRRGQPSFATMCFQAPTYALFSRTSALVLELYRDTESHRRQNAPAEWWPPQNAYVGAAVLPLTAVLKESLSSRPHHVVRLSVVSGMEGAPTHVDVRVALLTKQGTHGQRIDVLLSGATDSGHAQTQTCASDKPEAVDLPPMLEAATSGEKTFVKEPTTRAGQRALALAAHEESLDILQLDPSGDLSVFEASRLVAGLDHGSHVRLPDVTATTSAEGSDRTEHLAGHGMRDGMDNETRVLLQDVEQKQQIIARLHRHLDNCVTTLRDQVEQLMDGRGRVTLLQQESKSLTKSLNEHKSAVQASLDAQKHSSPLPRDQLVARYTETALQVEVEQTRLVEYRKRIQQLQNKRIRNNDAMRAHLLLEQHHTKLCAKVQRLQKSAAKASKLDAVYDKQVAVVRGLEQLVSDTPGVQLDPQTTSSSAAYRRLEAENARLRARLQSVQQVNDSNPEASEQALHQYTGHGADAGGDASGAAVDTHGDVRSLRRKIRHVMEATAAMEQKNAELQATHLARNDKAMVDAMRLACARERVRVLEDALAAQRARHTANISKRKGELVAVLAGGTVGNRGRQAHADALGTDVRDWPHTPVVFRKEKSIELSDV
eukprot:m.889297 g.889297  ORF g.889297 m.889297 type:complete len:1139 (-) comp23643_c0_seq1:113-3529(-)